MGDGPGSVSNSARIAPRDKVLTLRSFPRGGGTLLDLEFLQDDKGRRVAAVSTKKGAYSKPCIVNTSLVWLPRWIRGSGVGT
jgi:hypothetical protein